MNYLEDGILKYKNYTRMNDSAPIFPTGEGWELALRTLANFPFGYTLYEVEDIGRIKILINLPEEKWGKNPLDEKNYLVAVWDNDLLELKEMGYVDGVVPVDERDWRIENFKKMFKDYPIDKFPDFYNQNKDIIGFKIKNQITQILEPLIIKNPEYWFIREYFEDEYPTENIDDENIDDLIAEYRRFSSKEFVSIPSGLRVTESGYNKLIELSQNFNLSKELEDRIAPLINIDYFDTAIREVAIYFEYKLKTFHKSDNFGDLLISEHINYCKEKYGSPFSPGLKIYRQELRTVNKYIRNEYIHNLKSINIVNFNAILYRQNSLLLMINEVINTKNNP